MRNKEFSLYGVANAIAKLSLEGELDVIHLSESERSALFIANLHQFGGSEADMLSGLTAVKVLIYWSQERTEWVAFRILSIPIDMMYDEINYSYGKALDAFTRRKLAEAFNVVGTVHCIDRTSPEKLRLATVEAFQTRSNNEL
jgi:hypothetical protein